jgi:sugar/nucleoside kinase (ribokinase family)
MGSSLFSKSIIDAMNKAIAIVKSNGGTISFDPNIRKEMLKITEMREALGRILESTDIFLPSGDEVTLLVGANSEEEAVAELLRRGIKEIVVKNGVAGATFYDSTQQIAMPAIPVTEVDPTGAGDCFGATYVTCRKIGKSPTEAMRYAVASGARAVLKKGPMEGTSTFAELEEMLHR